MKACLVVLLLVVIGANAAYGEKGTFFDKVNFIQYSDDNTAVEEVKSGHLDIYYSAIPVDRLDEQARQNLNVYQSSGTSYSLLINPATSDEFNPFSIKDVRFALNYLVDRDLIVNEILKGYGVPMLSAYKPYDPDFLSILAQLQSLNFKHNPSLATSMISDALQKSGAQKTNNLWYYKSKPIKITIFIRNDDPIRKSIGEILASQFQDMGFTVSEDYGDLTKAFSVVYGSNPSDLKWSIYTEAWTMSGFVRYDSSTTAQMYSPWYSNMPGFNNPAYWNYQEPEIDSLSKAIFFGNFTSAQQRSELIRQAVNHGIHDSVRIFLACKVDQFVANKKVDGLINDFGAGITSRFTPINAKSDSDSLTIGVKKIYSGSWNPIAGFTDASSQQIWSVIGDSGSFKNPFTGYTIPVRSNWQVSANGPLDKIEVPQDAIRWNSSQQKWSQVGTGVKATSKVTFHLNFGNWHNGRPMDMNDVLYGIYFMYQWGTDQTNSTTFDSEFSPKAVQAAKNLVGVKVLDNNTIEVYQNYWHFDDGEIADSAQVWPAMPWEMMYSMEKAVKDGKLAFSRSDAVSKNIGWMSLIIPKDASILKENLKDFRDAKSIPAALADVSNPEYFTSRYNSSIDWIASHDNAVISNGPYYLESYSPDARKITLHAFDDPSYPIPAGYWNKFENIEMPRMEKIQVPPFVTVGEKLDIPFKTTLNSTVYYFITNSQGFLVDSGVIKTENGSSNIRLAPDKASNLTLGANDLQVFVVSDLAYKPDIYETSFLASNDTVTAFSDDAVTNYAQKDTGYANYFYVVMGIVVAVIFYMIIKRSRGVR